MSRDLIVRFHEAAGNRTAGHGRAATGRSSPRAAATCWRNRSVPLDVSDGIVAFTVTPFEIVTLRLSRA